MIYIGCAAAGLAALVLQIVLSLLGVGDHDGVDGHADVHVDHDGTNAGGFNLLSVRALASFLAFFGLTGWWLTATGAGSLTSALASFAVGAVAMIGVAWLASQQRRLDVEGTLDPGNAVGQTATVYLRVPAHGKGQGKVHVKVQGRTAELAATSDGPEIPTGAVVTVVRLITPDTVAVAPVE
jgi:hypothetical protein